MAAGVDDGKRPAPRVAAADTDQVMQQLIEHSYAQGAPDNIACVIADMVAV